VTDTPQSLPSRLFLLVIVLVACSGLGGAVPATAQPAFPVADLATGPPVSVSDVDSEFTAAAGRVFFSFIDENHGRELWSTDGTVERTGLVVDLCPGACSSNPRELVALGDLLFFVAEISGNVEIWTTDGTAEGTRRLTDFPFVAGEPAGLLALDNRIVFAVRSQPWSTDGTTEGTFALDIPPASSALAMGPVNGRALFVMHDSSICRIWATDGTPQGAELLQDSGSICSSTNTHPYLPHEVTGSGEGLFFLNDSGDELWVSDGTAPGTRKVKNIVSTIEFPLDRMMAPLGNRVVFVNQDAAHGAELWISDGTEAGTILLADIWPGPDGSSPIHLTQAGGHVFFGASPPQAPRRLWKTDGTPEGTVPVPGDFLFGQNESYLEPTPVALDSRLVFFADDQTHGYEPWVTDGTAGGTFLLADVVQGAMGSKPRVVGAFWEQWTSAGGLAYFRASPGGLSGERRLTVWATDGTIAGTRPLTSEDPPSSMAPPFSSHGEFGGTRPMAPLNGGLVFPAWSGSGSEPDLWWTDGTEAGTIALIDLGYDARSRPQEMTGLDGIVVFRVEGDDSLYRTDGTPESTFGLKPDEHGFPIRGTGLTRWKDEVLFMNPEDRQLWRTDGTEAGTVPVWPSGSSGYWATSENLLFLTPLSTPESTNDALWATDDLDAAPYSAVDGLFSSPAHLTGSERGIFFSAERPNLGRQLWWSNGNPYGTRLLTNLSWLETSPLLEGQIFHREVTPVGGLLFFILPDTSLNPSLWRSDGTPAGTFRLRAIREHASPYGSYELTPVRNRLFFVGYDSAHGMELWVSDGTVAGTRMVVDLRPGPESSNVSDVTAIGGVVLFSAYDPAHGMELWVSDGTAAGTRRVQDIAPGPLSSNPFGFTLSGPNVYFAANNGETGFELWAVPRIFVSPTFLRDVPVGHWAWRFIEAIAAAGLTGGCGPEAFCPTSAVTRAEMAVFLVRAAHGDAFVPPPATGTVFTDVPAGFWAGPWIEQLAADGVTGGCGGGQYCPGAQLSRAEMAVLLLRAAHGTGYLPPPATGTRFADVPADSWAAAWIEQLAAEGITSGCGGGLFCPAGTLTRAEMAVFLVQAFGLAVP
jgi:ELWxxDGT repeat protein